MGLPYKGVHSTCTHPTAVITDRHFNQHPVSHCCKIDRRAYLIAVPTHRNQALVAQHTSVASQANRKDLQRAIRRSTIITYHRIHATCSGLVDQLLMDRMARVYLLDAVDRLHLM